VQLLSRCWDWRAAGAKAVATTAGASRKRSKVWASERRPSARASVFEQRRIALVNDTQESPEKTPCIGRGYERRLQNSVMFKCSHCL
jgi:hypothetical protein